MAWIDLVPGGENQKSRQQEDWEALRKKYAGAEIDEEAPTPEFPPSLKQYKALVANRNYWRKRADNLSSEVIQKRVQELQHKFKLSQ